MELTREVLAGQLESLERDAEEAKATFIQTQGAIRLCQHLLTLLDVADQSSEKTA